MINYLNFLSQEDEEVKEAPTHLVTYKWSNKVNFAERAGQDPQRFLQHGLGRPPGPGGISKVSSPDFWLQQFHWVEPTTR